VYRLRIITAEY